MNNGKEDLKKDMSEDDIKYRQGRRKEQVEGHAICAMIGLIGIMSILVFLSLFA
jgi:hypothetical protein